MSAQAFGRYQLIRKLATGGMAEVWLAVQSGIEGFHRQLVIKRILPHLAEDPAFVQMFLNEAKIHAKFSHPNIGQIFDLGHQDGTYFIAMEFIQGEDLGRVMRKLRSVGQWMPPHIALRIVASACEGLAYAHAKCDEQGKPLKVVHRDISPQNILISFDGSVKVVDFGIAKAADHTALTRSGAIKGKIAYMSPEQAGGKVLDQRSDVFALGLVLYELLTNVRPLKRESELATLQAALLCDIAIPSSVAKITPALDGVVMRAVAKSASDRYEDARQFQIALEQLLVSEHWTAGSVQIAEMMHALFADRLKEDAAANAFAPTQPIETPQAAGALPPPGAPVSPSALPTRPALKPGPPAETAEAPRVGEPTVPAVAPENHAPPAGVFSRRPSGPRPLPEAPLRRAPRGASRRSAEPSGIP